MEHALGLAEQTLGNDQNSIWPLATYRWSNDGGVGRIGFARYRRRVAMRKVVVVIIVILAGLGACGSDDSEPSLSESITASSWMTRGGKIIEFREDGTFGVSTTEFDDVSSANREWGTWTLEGSVLTFNPDADSPYCAEEAGSYTISIVNDGTSVEATVEEDSCGGPRQSDFSAGLTRIADAE